MKKSYTGYTLVEILVVVLVFSILGLVITRVVVTTLRNTGKSENNLILRENVNYALGVIERNIRNADEIISCTGGSTLTYRSTSGSVESYVCDDSSGIGRIISSELDGNFITNEEISVDCSTVFICPPINPIDYVDINITAIDAASELGGENALTVQYSEPIRIKLRNY